ncbi:class I SAM-dependent methyltransferase [Motiliproteus sp. SC1-56]|uniref:class I SAM-dependent methyltransferase n=1 Tax=Motiliproteus sp. SC1-56 TaxID=2799565 RepID=UPI001A90A1BC|nr:class I SAM-dependent methyltransferase [Motiliproteus sp. SC1-56]
MNTQVSPLIDQTVSAERIKAQHKATWEDGDYARFAAYMQEGAIEVLQNWRIEPGTQVLDVGCGAGQTAIPAARIGAEVTGLDLAENLVEAARGRARNEALTARFDVGDAERLPYQERSYDTLISMFGAMFAPRPAQVVREFARVLKPGGRLIMANWTPTSMPAQMFKAVADVIPPAPGTVPPVLWGAEEAVIERLQEDFTDIQLTRRLFPRWCYPFDAEELLHLFRTCFGPVKRAFEGRNREQQAFLRRALTAIYEANSSVDNGILTITGGEFLEVIATRR